MKKTIIILLTLALCLNMVGCAGNKTKAKSDRAETRSGTHVATAASNHSYNADLKGEGGGRLFRPELLSFPEDGWLYWAGARTDRGLVICAYRNGEGAKLFTVDPENQVVIALAGTELPIPSSALDGSADGSIVCCCSEDNGDTTLLRVSKDGAVTRTAVKGLNGDQPKTLTASGNLCLLCGFQGVYAMGLNGEVLQAFTQAGGSVEAVKSGDTPILIRRTPDKTTLQVLDSSGRVDREISVAESYNGFFPGPEGEVFAQNGSTVYCLDLETGRPTGYVSAYASGFRADSFVWAGPDLILAPKGQAPALWTLSENQDLIVLRLATYDRAGAYILADSVRDYNDQSDRIKIDLINYAEYEGDNAQITGLDRLNTDILSGNVPDIYDLSVLPTRSLAQKGLLEDLTEWIDRDDSLSMEDFLPHIVDLLRRNGGLYDLVPAVGLRAVCGAEAVFHGERLTIDKLDELCTRYTADEIFGEVSQPEFLAYLLEYTGNDYLNTETASCRFDSPTFQRLLTLSRNLTTPDKKSMSREELQAWMLERAEQDSREERVLKGEQLLYFLNMSNAPVTMLNICDMLFQGKPCFVGFPSEQGSGTALYGILRLGMSANSEHKEEIWDFFRFLLSDAYLQSERWEDETPGLGYRLPGIPTLRGAYEKRMEVWVRYGSAHDGADFGGSGVAPVDPRSGERILELIDQADAIDGVDKTVLSLLADNVSAFYAGDKTAEETARIIQSKAVIYLAERYG